jgi:hypothetical protein
MNIRKCKHCKVKFDVSEKPKGWMANHSRWCDKNPKRKEYGKANNNGIMAMNKARKESGRTNQFTTARIDNKPIPAGAWKDKPGPFLDRKHTEETKRKISESALASPHRRLRRGIVEYKGVSLDSSWELALAKRLDELNVKWIRPEPIPWIDDEGITHNYFPDFYLPEKNLYLDPKNPHAVKVQRKKLKKIMSTYDNIIILESLQQCEEYTP